MKVWLPFPLRFAPTETVRPQATLMTLFHKALSDVLTSLDPPPTLDAFVTMAIRTDNRVREREREKREVKAPQGKGN